MVASTQPKFENESLEELFVKFNIASAKLEDRYEKLLRETNDLRDQLKIKDQEIKRGERLAILGETAAAIAHEIRNPLGSIKLFLSLLEIEIQENQPACALVDQINQSMFRLNSVISNILHFSKEEQPVHGLVNLHTLISEQISQANIISDGAIVIEQVLQANPFMQGQEESIRQVLGNIFTNAIQACPNSNGKIQVRTIDVDNKIMIAIRDNGSGVVEGDIDRIFDPFVTTKCEGTGLGLAIVKRIVEQHQGQISAINCEKGAEFQIVFPRKQKY